MTESYISLTADQMVKAGKNDFLFARLGCDISVLLIPRRVCTIATVTIPVKEATIFKTKSRMLTSLRFKQMLAG